MPIMRTPVKAYHWINTFTGFLDAALHLTEDEQVQVMAICGKMLGMLNIPDRGQPISLANPVALEVASSFYSTLLNGPRDSGRQREIRRVTGQDMYVSLEAWREALLGMILTGYPDLSGEERLVAARTLTDLLVGLGVPDRAASHLPDAVIRTARHTDLGY